MNFEVLPLDRYSPAATRYRYPTMAGRLLEPPEAEELRKRIAGYCTRDEFAQEDGSYRIRSLYLDTWNMSLYKANDREAPRRFKARVRSYPDAPGGPVFAEIKARVGDVIQRLEFGRDQIEVRIARGESRRDE